MVTHPDPADDDLALKTSQGDRDAFAELYSRHFPGVYDLVFRMVRDHDVAADTAQNAFIRAWESLQKRTVTGNVRAWLHTIARNTALNEIKRKKRWRTILERQPEGRQSTVYDAIDTSRLSNPEAVVGDQELVDLVWTSAAALGPRDYSLLDLHLRRDLSPSEMATDLGLSGARVHVMLSRLKNSLEESVTVALMVLRGRRDCPQLSEILSERSTADLSRDVRLQVRGHLKVCDLCAERRKRFVAPAEIFSALAMVPVSDEMTADTWSRISPLLLPGAGSLAFLAAARARAGDWWAGASVGARAAGFVVLGAVVAVPVAVSLLVIAGGGAGADDPDGTKNSSAGIRLASSRTKPPGSSAAEGESSTPTPTPQVAAIVASPGPTQGTGAPTPLAPGQTPPPSAATPAPSTSTPASTPAPPTSGPLPTVSPAPSNQADLFVVSVDLVNSPASAGLPFQLSASALLRNLGGAPSALADTTFTLSAPTDCVFSPAAPAIVQNKNLPLGSDVSITRTWSITCSTPGDHSFGVSVSVGLDPGQALTDPNPANNANFGTIPVAVGP